MTVGSLPGTSDIHRRPLNPTSATQPGPPSPPPRSTSASLTPGFAGSSVALPQHAGVSVPVGSQLPSPNGLAPTSTRTSANSGTRPMNGDFPSIPVKRKKPQISSHARQDGTSGSKARRTGVPDGKRRDLSGFPSDKMKKDCMKLPVHGSPLSSDVTMLIDASPSTEPARTDAMLTETTPDSVDGTLHTRGDLTRANPGRLDTFQRTSPSAREPQGPAYRSAGDLSQRVPGSSGGMKEVTSHRPRTVKLLTGQPTSVIGPSAGGHEGQLSEKSKGKRRAIPSVDGEKNGSRKRKKVERVAASHPSTNVAQPISLAPSTPSGDGSPVIDFPKSSMSSIRSGPARSKKRKLMDENGQPLPEPTGTKPPKVKKGVRITPWRPVRPAPSVTSQNAIRPAALSAPRVWCSSLDDLEAAAPTYKRSGFMYGVRRGMLDAPTLLFSDANDKHSNLGLHPEDRWTGRHLTFTMTYEYKPVLTSAKLDQSSLQVKEEAMDTVLPMNPPPRSSSPALVYHAPQIEPSTSGSSYSSLEVASDMDLDMPLVADLVPDHSYVKDPPTCAFGDFLSDKIMSLDTDIAMADDRPAAFNAVSDAPSAMNLRLKSFHLNESDTLSDLSPPTVSSTFESPAIGPVPLVADSSVVVENPATSPIPSLDMIEHPNPPPEVQMLLDAHLRKCPVAPLFSRSSPILPWRLENEVGCFWAGLFTVEKFEESTQTNIPSSPNTVRRSWTFHLRWVPGGEYLLRDEEKDEGAYNTWLRTVERPWWEARTSGSGRPELKGDAERYAELVSSLIPDGLLASFNTILLGESNFPHGFYCRKCGRINVQTSLVRQDCVSSSCAVSSVPTFATSAAAEWVPARSCILAMADSTWIPAVSTRVSKRKGMSTRTYSVPDGPDVYAPPSEGGASHMVATHIFTSNMFKHQEVPSDSFTKIQRCIPFQRSKSEFAFLASSTFPPAAPSGDNLKGRVYELGAFEHVAELIRDRVAEYGDGIGVLEIKKLSIKTWVSMKDQRVKEDLPRVPVGGVVAIMCLGANTQIGYTPQAMKAAMKADTRFKGEARKEAFRVVLIHGDVLVLSGAAIESGLQVGVLRTGTTMFVVAECSRASQT